ncbi:sigma-70 family RNA polymerase sigma factor [Sabulilitoribacter arenilitoris]|uniref:Sigma-70 family RNA polymerase sigma factor n=1 Tax=Wocania arenilitoris TaxID=2044858 RepID=A0AAE3JNL6_9FLAO|nr:sigma-70 family RNA polymerase sigma factor [Wocania arenilitoris]MCF7568806.1 sigma-70 family RNA polymerase sigma factor [Wocania arenilitoris]
MINNFKNNTFLIDSLKKGNEKAYTFLINTYHKKLFVYALSLTNDYAMTQDLVQNVFLRTWELRSNLKSDFLIKNFLYKSVYNEFVNQYHRNKSISVLEKAYVEALNEVKNEDYQELLVNKTALISNEIENLPKKCKRTFLLSKKEGLTNIEIAEYLNVSIKTVEYHINKAYKLIRKGIEKKAHKILFFILGNGWDFTKP